MVMPGNCNPVIEIQRDKDYHSMYRLGEEEARKSRNTMCKQERNWNRMNSTASRSV